MRTTGHSAHDDSRCTICAKSKRELIHMHLEFRPEFIEVLKHRWREASSSQVFRGFVFNWYGGGGESNWVHSALRPPAPGDYDDVEIGEMTIGRGNRSTRRKLAPVPLCPPQIPHAAQTRTRAVAVGSQRLTTWATAWPFRGFPQFV
jgi:hypothetical protein